MGKSLVLGFFDGVHKAHRAVIESAFNGSDDVTLITFKESPAVYFGYRAEYILSRKESVKKIKSLGVKDVIELNFPEIAGITAEKYLDYIVLFDVNETEECILQVVQTVETETCVI